MRIMTEIGSNDSRRKCEDVRRVLEGQGLGGFIIPRTDEFQGEYIPACAERLKWLTGFTGSAGTAVVLADRAVALSDGRYTLQLRQQVDAGVFECEDSTKISPEQWIVKNASPGSRIGYDPRLHTSADLKRWQAAVKGSSIEFVPVSDNLIDAVWRDRPPSNLTPVEIFPEEIAGRSAADKRAGIAAAITKAGAYAAIIASPESVAWMLNVRARDVPHTPLPLSYMAVHADGTVDWFIDPARIGPDVMKSLGSSVHVRPTADLGPVLTALGAAAKAAGKPVLADPQRTPLHLTRLIEATGAAVQEGEDPCLIPRACKNQFEQDAIIRAHIRDGVAVTRFLHWLSREAPRGALTELSVEEKLCEFRRADPHYRDDSFSTIAGWAGHGAIVHYRATAATNATIKPPGILLIDSGAQYDDGTTDITRTVTLGDPVPEVRENFTRVLKGHIAVATARIPEGTTGVAVDAFARRALWDAGLDYDHGTGHGVGCYLSVHEPAASISKKGMTPFRAGMLISNEPGYYKEGAYGIRIENLVLVRAAKDTQAKMLEFETVTLAPIDRRLIVPELLEARERAWIDAYHERVYQTLSPHLEPDVARWLRQETLPLAKNEGPGMNRGPQCQLS